MFSIYDYINAILLTIGSSIISCWGLISNNNIILVAATLMAVSSQVIYNIIKESILNPKVSKINILYYILIILGIPLIISIFIGYIFEFFKKKYPNMDFDIPSKEIKEMLNPGSTSEDKSIYPHKINANIVIPMVVSLIASSFLPNSVKNGDITLSTSISSVLAFVTPLTIIGLMLGSNHYTKHDYSNLKDYIVPLIMLCSNVFGISFFTFVAIYFFNYH